MKIKRETAQHSAWHENVLKRCWFLFHACEVMWLVSSRVQSETKACDTCDRDQNYHSKSGGREILSSWPILASHETICE